MIEQRETREVRSIIAKWKVFSVLPMESSMMAVLGEAEDVPNDPGWAWKDYFDKLTVFGLM